jgi:hypothetical protein
MQYCLCALILLLLKLIRADEFSQVHEKKNLYTLEVPNSQIDNWLSSSLVERQPGDPTLSRWGSRFESFRGQCVCPRVFYQSMKRTLVKLLHSGDPDVMMSVFKCSAIGIRTICFCQYI